MADVHRHGIIPRNGTLLPYEGVYLARREDLAGIAHEQLEYFVFLRSQRDLLAVKKEFLFNVVDLKAADNDPFGRLLPAAEGEITAEL